MNGIRKYKYIKRFLAVMLGIIGTSLILASCERDITVKLPDIEQKIVVEGWIEQGSYAAVSLTRNSAYFDPVDSAILANIIVSDAKVLVSDGTMSEELSLVFDPTVFPPVLYRGNSVVGVVGGEYDLTVISGDDTLRATTSIPEPVEYDSLWFKLGWGTDSLGSLFGLITDPAGEENYYRIFTKRLGRDESFIPTLGSVYSDQFFDGISVDFSITRGFGTYSDDFEPDDEFPFYKIGDTVVVRSCSITKDHYLFWRGIENSIFSGGNPFATPSIIPSNIEGGLGIWGGYGCYYATIIPTYIDTLK